MSNDPTHDEPTAQSPSTTNNESTDADDRTAHDTDEHGSASSTSRRGFVQAAAVGASVFALGTTTAVAGEDVTLAPTLDDDTIESGGTTTATFAVDGSPSGSEGASIEIELDPDVAQITEVELGEYAPSGLEDRINDDIEDAGGAVASIDAQAWNPDGIDDSEYELATFHLEAQSDGTTEIGLVDASVDHPDDEDVTVNYEAPTLTVGDGGGGGEDPPETPTVSVDPGEATVDPGDGTTVSAGLNVAPNGLSGYKISVSVDTDVATVADAAVGSDFEDATFSDVEISEGEATIQAIKSVDAGTTDLEFATVDLEGVADGKTTVSVDESDTLPIEDGDGNPLDPEFESGLLTVGDGEADEPPTAPDGLEVVATDETSIEVDWNAVPDAVEYGVYLDTQEETDAVVVDFSFDDLFLDADRSDTVDAPGYTFEELDPGTTYEIGVTAVGEDGTETDPVSIEAETDERDTETPTVSVDPGEATVDPGDGTTVSAGLNVAPDGLSGYKISVSVDTDVATVADAAVGSDFEDATFSDVERSEGEATIEAVKAVDAGATDLEFATVDLEGVADGKTTVTVDESDTLPIEDGDGTPLDPAFESGLLTVGDGEADEPPAVPDGLEVVATDETSIEVDWNAVPNAVEYALSLDGEAVTTVEAPGYTFEDLDSGTTYEIAVVAVDDAGRESDPATLEAATGDEPPNVPAGLDVVATGETSIELDWDDDPNAARYAVYLDGTRRTETGTTGYTFEDLDPGTEYDLGVAAVSEDGSETDRAVVTASTDSEDGGGGGGGEYPEWDPDEVYRSGDRVHWDGQNWEAQWYNTGKEPSHEPFTAWKAIDGELPEPDSPHAELDPSTTTAAVGERIQFDVVDTTDDDHWITDLSWTFGDGTTASGWWNAHAYDSAGTYTVTLTATDQRGRETTHEVEITVS